MLLPITLTTSIVVFVFCTNVASAPTIQKTEPALLVVSYDAFRPEYLKRGVTPNMNKFRSEGTSAKFLSNVFPTKTFVNHHTIATVSHHKNKNQNSFIFVIHKHII